MCEPTKVIFRGTFSWKKKMACFPCTCILLLTDSLISFAQHMNFSNTNLSLFCHLFYSLPASVANRHQDTLVSRPACPPYHLTTPPHHRPSPVAPRSTVARHGATTTANPTPLPPRRRPIRTPRQARGPARPTPSRATPRWVDLPAAWSLCSTRHRLTAPARQGRDRDML